MPRKTPLKFPLDYYSVSSIRIAETLTLSQVRSEYSRLSRIARQRLSRFRGSDRELDIYKNNVGEFPPLSELQTNEEILRRLSRVARFLSSERSSISGVRKWERENIETLHEHGYDFVNRSNFREFADFMEAARNDLTERQYDSERVAELFGELQRKRVDTDTIRDDFAYWLVHEKELSEIKRQPKGTSADKMRKAIEDERKRNKSKNSRNRNTK